MDASQPDATLRPGEAHLVQLTGRGARGYVWTWTVEGDAAVEVTAVPTPAPPGVPRPGSTLLERYQIRAVAPGRAVVRFLQGRPPYPDEPPFEERRVTVLVR